MNTDRISNKVVAIFLLIITLAGCASVPQKSKEPSYSYPERKTAIKRGAYHKVKKGETLWRIAKLYGVDLAEIVSLNNLPDATRISAGQLIFIPGEHARELKTEAVSDNKRELNYFIWPVRGKVVSFFGLRRTNNTINKGIDILANEGNDILATKSGVVEFCSEKIKGLGKIVIIKHDDSFSSVYANTGSILVSVGQKVEQGEAIARLGGTQTNGGNILHFEIRKDHIPQNPFYFLP
jgi:murein DD-endopeptidase MepM/ murein hydrolase activator NlpD